MGLANPAFKTGAPIPRKHTIPKRISVGFLPFRDLDDIAIAVIYYSWLVHVTDYLKRCQPVFQHNLTCSVTYDVKRFDL
jgi:hypothetical protein